MPHIRRIGEEKKDGWDLAELLALADQVGPDLLQHSILSKALKPAVNRRGAPEVRRHLPPLALTAAMRFSP